MLTFSAKCVDTFISISQAPKAAQAGNASSLQSHLPNSAFSQKSNGATSTSAGLTSPITPFSQSALPSKSLLSRQETPSGDAGGDDVSVTGPAETPLVLQRGVQGQLQAVINRLFEQCFRQKRYRQVVGIAVEAKDLSVLRQVILRASEDEGKQGESSRRGEELMEYVLDICMSIVQERAFRNEVSLAGIFKHSATR